MNDNNAVKAAEPDDKNNAYLLLFYKDEILVEVQNGGWRIPALGAVHLSRTEAAAQYIGEWAGKRYYGANINEKPEFPGLMFVRLKQLSQHTLKEYWSVAFRAYHLLNWLKNNRFCGRCGDAMQLVVQGQEQSLNCTACSNIVYPRISPAIIVAVFKEDQILLAHASRFPPGRYSVIAGFVEPGETMENCVKRELREEVGLEVNNIEYFGSQPWPFPDSLMIAFTANYVSGQIAVDHSEILTADWFSAHTLPEIPEKGTISRQLIDWFLHQQQQPGQIGNNHHSQD